VPDLPAGSDDSRSDWERDLQRLRERYRRKLQPQLAMLEELLRDARQGASAECSLEAAHRLAHRLKGTSGTYGLQESFAALETIEEQLGLILDAVPDARAAWGRIEEALERASTELVTT
jgi:HPt (histidine-containing phosphotransfer) domain-containing protein